MPVGHDSEKAIEKRNSMLTELDFRLDNIITTMDMYPSFYKQTIEYIKSARKEIPDNLKNAVKYVRKAYHSSLDESLVIMDYWRVVNIIPEEDPIFKNQNVADTIKIYYTHLKTGEVKKAEKDVKRLDKLLRGCVSSVPLMAKLESSVISKDDPKITLVINNLSKQDLIINSINVTSNVVVKDVGVNNPVIKSMDKLTTEIVLNSEVKDQISLNVAVTYTKDLVPSTQRYTFKVTVE